MWLCAADNDAVAVAACCLCLCVQGAAANLVETEQLVTLDDGRVVASYVQVGQQQMQEAGGGGAC